MKVSEYLHLMILDKIMTFAGITASVHEVVKYPPKQQNSILHKFLSERPHEPEFLQIYMGVVINMVAKFSGNVAFKEYETSMFDSFANKKVTICQGTFKSTDFIMASSPLSLFPSIRNEETEKTPVQVCENSSLRIDGSRICFIKAHAGWGSAPCLGEESSSK